MPDFRRFAIFDPGPAPLARFGARWFGWDAAGGQSMPALAPDHVVAAPRRYGFHATIKPPFRLADGRDVQGLMVALRRLAATLAPVSVPDGLTLTCLGNFVALVADPQPPDLTGVAARVVEALDGFRAPLTPEDRARRRPDGLSVAERHNLDAWGYPYVMDSFRYHMTLSGPLSPAQAAALIARLGPMVGAVLPAPHPIDTLALMGEDAAGRFHVLDRVSLGQ